MNYTDFINPEIAIIVPILATIGMFCKASILPDKSIPLILGCSGIVLATLWTLATSELLNVSDWCEALLNSVAQGVFCAATAVYGHQVIKQVKKDE